MSVKQFKPLVQIINEEAKKLEFRQRRGQRHPMKAILKMVFIGLLCNCQSYTAIAQWIKDQGSRFARKLGFKKHGTPSASTLHRVLKSLNPDHLEQILGKWAEDALKIIAPDKYQAIAIDGKKLRGSLKQGSQEGYLLSAISHGLGLTLTQTVVPLDSNEIPTCLSLLDSLVFTGRIITVDALHTQQELSQKIVANGGDYVMIAKGNQHKLCTDIEYLFNDPPKGSEFFSCQTLDCGHGRIELRRLTTSTALTGYLSWPGIAQVFQLARTVQFKKSGKQTHEIVYGITSLPEPHCSARLLLHLVRQHWHIENKSHYVRDVVFGEDLSQVRAVNLPHNLATFRNSVISLLRIAGFKNLALARRQFASKPYKALRLLHLCRRQ